MGHEINGFLVFSEDRELVESKLPGSRGVALGHLFFFPLVDDVVIQVIDAKTLPEAITTPWLVSIVGADLSTTSKSPVAYIETEYFGGHGEQTAVFWVGGKIQYFGQNSYGPINHALRTLGVKATADLDEFDTVGLARYRSNRDFQELTE